jgi:hypothetical protein
MAITTDKSAQSAILKYYSVGLDINNIKVIKSSRGGPHLRINYTGDVQSLLNSILPCTIKASDVAISGSFVTYEVEIKKSIDGADRGDKIYFVNAISSRGVLKTKQLTPNKLGLAGKKISKNTFISEVNKGIKKIDAPDNIKAFMGELLKYSDKNGNIKSTHIESITDPDINIIAKDYGEVTGAWWFMNVFNTKADSIMYPAEESAALVDYYIYVGKKKIAVSAKANEGAPPSINSIAAILKNISYTETDKENARKAIIAISDYSTVEGIVNASKNLKTPGYKWLQKNLFNSRNDFSPADCETVLKPFKKPQEALDVLLPFYVMIKRAASAEISKRIFDTKAQRYGMILSPLGYHLVDQLNNNPVYLSVLNDAAQSILVSQIYMKINKSNKTVSYNVKEFSASAFKFEYNANAGQPSLKKISFKMDKTKTKTV